MPKARREREIHVMDVADVALIEQFFQPPPRRVKAQFVINDGELAESARIPEYGLSVLRRPPHRYGTGAMVVPATGASMTISSGMPPEV